MSAEMKSIENLMTKTDLAKKLRCCHRTVDNLIKSKSISVVKIGRAVRFKREDVTAFLESFTIKSAA